MLCRSVEPTTHSSHSVPDATRPVRRQRTIAQGERVGILLVLNRNSHDSTGNVEQPNFFWLLPRKKIVSCVLSKRGPMHPMLGAAWVDYLRGVDESWAF